MKKLFLFVAGLALAFAILGAVMIIKRINRIETIPIEKGAFMEGKGEYPIGGGKFTVRVWIQDGIYRYRVSDAEGRKLFTSIENASDDAKWFAYWDEKDQLWVHSERIGVDVWTPEAGNYREMAVSYDAARLVPMMPAAFYERLGEDKKKEWGAHRNKP